MSRRRSVPNREVTPTRRASHTQRTAAAFDVAPLFRHSLKGSIVVVDPDIGVSERVPRSTEELVAIRSQVTPSSPLAHRWTPGRLAIAGGVLLYLTVILLVPLLALVVEAVRTGAPAIVRALAEPDARFALVQSLWLTLIAVVVNGIFGVATAIVLVRQRFVGRGVLDALVDLSLAVSPVMIGLSFLLLVGRDGWFWPWLDAAGIRVAFAFPGLVIATLFVTLPFTVREVVHVLAEVGTDEEQVASTLGASWLRTFWKVTLPNIRRGLLLGITLTAARALGEFGAILVLGGAIAKKTDTATTYIYGALEERQNAGAYGMALVLGIVSMLLLIAIERFKNREIDQ
jgi:sulfate transport system permease protein